MAKTTVTIDCGFSCGRYWIRINDVMICQTQGDDVWMRDSDVCDLARAIVPGCDFDKAFRLPESIVGVELLVDNPGRALGYIPE